jgi:hypothetical protein
MGNLGSSEPVGNLDEHTATRFVSQSDGLAIGKKTYGAGKPVT